MKESEFPQKNTNFIHNIYCRRRRLVKKSKLSKTVMFVLQVTSPV